MNPLGMVTHELHEAEAKLLSELRSLRKLIRTRDAERPAFQLTLGQRIADMVAAAMGSWKFIIIQTTILVIWIVLNVTAYVQKWDPYPFILLNLALSFQAAYAAPFIMMSQNRQQDIDRQAAENDRQVNIKAELEIELLRPEDRRDAREGGALPHPGDQRSDRAPSRAGHAGRDRRGLNSDRVQGGV